MLLFWEKKLTVRSEVSIGLCFDAAEFVFRRFPTIDNSSLTLSHVLADAHGPDAAAGGGGAAVASSLPLSSSPFQLSCSRLLPWFDSDLGSSETAISF